MVDEQGTERAAGRWSGRVTAILISAFIALVVLLMFLAVRGPL